jgi:RNA polymerase sigma factor (sigma-70 family)
MTILKTEKTPTRSNDALSPGELVEAARGFLGLHSRRKAKLLGLDADDLFQEATVALMELSGYFNPERGSPCTFAKFAMKAAVARLVDEQVKRRREVGVMRNDDGDALERLAVTHDPADERAGARLEAEAALAALGRLPQRWQFVVRRYLGVGGAAPETFKTIGAALGIGEERARQIYHRAVSRLRQRLALTAIPRKCTKPPRMTPTRLDQHSG